MSLIVWLPLLGTTTNQGLSTQAFDVSNTTYITVDNTGKLGKCYSFNSSATNNGIFSADGGFMANYINNKSWSLCAWVQTTATDTCVMSLSYGLRMYAGNSTHTFVSLYNSSRTVNCMSSVASNDGNWHHLCATYDVTTNAIKFYVDGVNTGNATYTSGYTYASSWVNGLFIGRDPNNSTVNDHYLFKGKMNDVRIYTHALSQKEVKEISKGLIAHYLLNGNGTGGDNVLTNSTGYNGTANWGGVISVGTENEKPYLIAQRTNTTSTSRTFVSHSTITSAVSSWVAGDKFTISGYYRVPSSETYAVPANMFIRWVVSTGSNVDTGFNTPSTSTVVKDAWIRFENTYTVPSNYVDGAVNFYLSAFSQGLSTVHWKDIKLEKGEKATPWLPNSADAEYSLMGYDDTTVYDCSGYNYHGTKSGSPTISSESSRYTCCSYIADGLTDKFTGSINLNNDAITMSIWVKSKTGAAGTGNYHQPFNISGNRYEMSIDTSGRFRNGFFVNDTRVVNTASNANIISDLKWHMITATFDGTIIRRYVDGVEVQTQSASGTLTGGTQTFYIGGPYGTNTSYGTKELYLSDARVYSTALSADDILELYHTGASIDNSGNMYAYEFNEV